MIKNIDLIKQDEKLVKVIMYGILMMTENMRVDYLDSEMKDYVVELLYEINKK